MDLVKEYEKQASFLEKDIETCALIGVGVEYKMGQLVQLNMVINDLKKQKLSDRFFLEEIVNAIAREDSDHYETLCRDFLKEYVNEIPLTERERSKYIKEVIGVPEEYFFKCESDLDFYLTKRYIASKAELRQHKIQNIIS